VIQDGDRTLVPCAKVTIGCESRSRRADPVKPASSPAFGGLVMLTFGDARQRVGW